MNRQGSLWLKAAVAGLLGALFVETASAQEGLAPPAPGGYTLVLDDPLRGSTKGDLRGGSIDGTGFQVLSPDDHITFEVPLVSDGAAEFSVTGLGESLPAGGDAELFIMYDGSFSPDPETSYEGFRNNPYKFALRQREDTGSVKVVFKNRDLVVEDNGPRTSWDPNATYRFRVEWGGGVAKIYRDGALQKTLSPGGTWAPRKHRIRVGSGGAGRGWPGTTTTDLKVWRKGGGGPVATPPPLSNPVPRGGTGSGTGSGTSPAPTNNTMPVPRTDAGPRTEETPPRCRGFDGQLDTVFGGPQGGQPWVADPWMQQPRRPGFLERLIVAIVKIVGGLLSRSASPPMSPHMNTPLGGE